MFSHCNIPYCDPLGERGAKLLLATQVTNVQHEYVIFYYPTNVLYI